MSRDVIIQKNFERNVLRKGNASFSVEEIFTVPKLDSEEGTQNEPIESNQLNGFSESKYKNAATNLDSSNGIENDSISVRETVSC